MKKHRNKIIAGAVVVVALALVFWWGGNAPGLHGWSSAVHTEVPTPSALPAEGAEAPPTPTEVPNAAPEEKEPLPVKKKDEPATKENKPAGKDNKPLTAEEKVDLAAQMAGGPPEAAESGSQEYSALEGMQLGGAAGNDPVLEGRPSPMDPKSAVITNKASTCTLSVRCDTILENWAWLDPEKAELVPEDGVIFPEQTVTFYEGESVFNVLLREMKKNKIHMEFKNTPIYNSAYIEGIQNIYELDCGELSGWMYRVNGWFPNYGCSRYALKEGDRVEWVYTCDLGADVGGVRAAAGEGT